MKISYIKFNEKLVKFSSNGVYILDLIKGQNISVNSQYTQLTTYTSDTINKLSEEEFYSLSHPNHRLSMPNHTKKIEALKGNEILELEYPFKKAKGSWMLYGSKEVTANISIEDKTTKYIGSFADITTEKWNEAKADDLNQRLTLNIETASLEILGTLVYNDSIQRIGDVSKIYGCTADKIPEYTTSTTFVHPDDQIDLGKRHEPSVYDIEDHEFMYKITDTNKKLRYIRPTFKTIYDANGDASIYLGNNKFIKEKTSKSEILSTTQKKLLNYQTVIKNGQKQLQNYFHTMPSIILILDKQRKVEIIKVTTLNKEEGATIVIPDNGSDINTELGDQIFWPFVTNKKVGKGTNLSLSIIFSILKTHYDIITCTSKNNKKSSFRVYLPNEMKE